MKKLFLFILIAASLSAGAQDTTKPKKQLLLPTDEAGIQYLSEILMDSRLSKGGVPLNGKELAALMEWLRKPIAVPAPPTKAAPKK